MPVESIDEPAAVVTTDVLREVNGAHGSTYALVRPLVGGVQSGAWLLRDESGTTAVLKWSPNKSWAGQIQRASRAVARVRRQGYATPAWLAVGITSSGYGYQVQQYVAGRPLDQLPEKAARSLIDVLELHTDLDPDPDRFWFTYVTDWLRNKVAADENGGGCH